MVFTIVSWTHTHTHSIFMLLSKYKAKQKKGNALVRYTHILVYVAVKFNFLSAHTQNIFWTFSAAAGAGFQLTLSLSLSLFCSKHFTTHILIVYSCHRLRVQTHVKMCASVCYVCTIYSIVSKQKPSSQLTVQIVIGIFFVFSHACVGACVCIYCIQCDGFLYQEYMFIWIYVLLAALAPYIGMLKNDYFIPWNCKGFSRL